MGRHRSTNKHLPRRMVFQHGAYYHVLTVGKSKRWTPLSRDFGAALKKWAEIEGRDAPVPQNVAGLVSAYLVVSQATLAAETMKGYQRSAVRLAKVFGHMRPEDLKREHVYRYLREHGNVQANRDRALLGAAYTHAINLGLRVANPAHGLRFRNPEKPRLRYVEHDELQALINAATPAFGNLIRFAYLTGMGEGDICRLLLTAGTKEGIRYERHKTGEPVLIAWSDELRSCWNIAAGSRIGAQPLFLTSRVRRKGEHRGAYTTDGLRSVWARVRAQAGIRDVTFHDLRRKAGSDAQDEQHAQQLLAHADPATTRKHYRAKLTAVKPVR